MNENEDYKLFLDREDDLKSNSLFIDGGKKMIDGHQYRVKNIIEILLDIHEFGEEHLRYISLLYQTKYVAVLNIDLKILWMSNPLLRIIGNNWIKSNKSNLNIFFNKARENPGKCFSTGVTIEFGKKQLNIEYSEEFGNFNLYFNTSLEYDKHTIEIMNYELCIINEVIGFKDNETLKHTQRVGDMSSYLARLIGKDEEYIGKMRSTAPLHDLGKIKIPDGILLNKGKLTTDEFDIIKTHTVEGGKIIDKLRNVFHDNNIFDLIKNIILYHHEKFDGTGYPEGLIGNNIPLEARIVSIIDVFDALKSKRSYKEPFTDDKVHDILLKGRGTSFDPEILDIFMKHYYEMVGVRGMSEDID